MRLRSTGSVEIVTRVIILMGPMPLGTRPKPHPWTIGSSSILAVFVPYNFKKATINISLGKLQLTHL